MNSFYQIRDFQIVLFKRYKCLGLQDWFVDSGTIPAGSVSEVFEGRHYYHTIHLQKKDLMLLLQEKQKILLINLSLYIWTFSVISQDSGKNLQAQLCNTLQTKKNTKS